MRTPPSRTPAAAPKPPTAPQAPRAMFRSRPSANVVIRIDERGGRDRGRAEALERTGADQRGLRPGETAQQRADGEEHEAGHEDAPASENVGRAAAEEQEPAEDQRVRARSPTAGSPARTPRSSWIEGSATFTIAMSSTTMNCTAPEKRESRTIASDGEVTIRSSFRQLAVLA